MKTFLINISLFLKQIGHIFVQFFRFHFGILKRGDKNKLIYLSLACISCLCTVFSLLSGQYMSNIKPQKLSEISNDFVSQNKDGYGVLYGHKLLDYEQMYFLDCETAKEMREVDYKNIYFNFYQANYNGYYSPCVVNYEAGVKSPTSLLLWPKKTYVKTEFQYEMPLLYPSNSVIPELPNSNDIYINQRWADYLLGQDGLGAGNYAPLINREVTIPYQWNYGQSETRANKLIDSFYVIKGIINDGSTQYQQYKALFGDFFLANEFIHLPIPELLFFDLKNYPQNNRKTFELLLDKYQYTSTKTSSLDGTNLAVFEYRIGFFSKMDSKNNILQIDNESNEWTVKINQLFDGFTSKQNVIYLILYLVFDLICFAGLIFLTIRYSFVVFDAKSSQLNETANTNMFVFINLYCLLSIGLIIGTTIMRLLYLTPRVSSYQNWISFLIVICELFISAIANFILAKRSHSHK